MFDTWLRNVQRFFFWWLPENDKASDSAGDRTPDRPTYPEDHIPNGDASPRGTGHSCPADDLTAIKGIGPAVQQKLNEMGIHTFRELAAADADTVARHIGVRSITTSKVEIWQEEAAKQPNG